MKSPFTLKEQHQQYNTWLKLKDREAFISMLDRTPIIPEFRTENSPESIKTPNQYIITQSTKKTS